jgi:hypothetical protein
MPANPFTLLSNATTATAATAVTARAASPATTATATAAAAAFPHGRSRAARRSHQALAHKPIAYRKQRAGTATSYEGLHLHDDSPNGTGAVTGSAAAPLTALAQASQAGSFTLRLNREPSMGPSDFPSDSASGDYTSTGTDSD